MVEYILCYVGSFMLGMGTGVLINYAMDKLCWR